MRGTPESPQAHTPLTGITRHISSIYFTTSGYNYTAKLTTEDPHTMEVDPGGLGAGRRGGIDTGSSELTQYDRLQGAVSRLMLDHKAMHAAQTLTAMAPEALWKQLHESQRKHCIDI